MLVLFDVDDMLVDHSAASRSASIASYRMLDNVDHEDERDPVISTLEDLA